LATVAAVVIPQHDANGKCRWNFGAGRDAQRRDIAHATSRFAIGRQCASQSAGLRRMTPLDSVRRIIRGVSSQS